MCTSLAARSVGPLFGRNLDLEYSFGEQVVITPRRYPFPFRLREPLPQHYALIGMATVVNNYPLYAEAMNEKGLYMAGLNFPGNAYYPPAADSGTLRRSGTGAADTGRAAPGRDPLCTGLPSGAAALAYR